MLKTYKLSDHFWMHELFSEDFANRLVKSGRPAQWYLSSVFIYTLETIRDQLGKPVIINNWYNGGDYQLRGFRTSQENTSIYNGKVREFPSQHERGIGADFEVVDVSPAEVQEYLKKKFRTGGLGCGKTFTHFDRRDSLELVLWSY